MKIPGITICATIIAIVLWILFILISNIDFKNLDSYFQISIGKSSMLIDW